MALEEEHLGTYCYQLVIELTEDIKNFEEKKKQSKNKKNHERKHVNKIKMKI